MKRIKNLILAFVLLPCVLLLGACGGDTLKTEAQLNTKGTYSDATVADYQNIVGTDDSAVNEKTNIKGYRLTIKTESADGSSSAIVNGIVDLENNELAIRSVMKGEELGVKVDVESELYYTNGYAYVYANGMGTTAKYKMQLDVKDNLDGNNDLIASYSEMLNTLFTEIHSKIDDEEVVVKSYTKGSTNKFEITADDYVYYVVFEDNQLVGVTSSYSTEYATINYVLVAYDKAIDFPSFKDYQEIPSGMDLNDFFGE